MNLLYLIYFVAGRPIVEGFYLELFNEVTVQILCYIMVVFTNYVEDVDVKYYTGYVFTAILLFGILFNIGIITKQVINCAG